VGVAQTARRAMTTAFISHSDCGRHDTGWGAPEHVGRIRAITRAFRERPELFMRLLHHEGRHATPQELALVHDEWVRRFPAPVEHARHEALAAQAPRIGGAAPFALLHLELYSFTGHFGGEV